MRCSNNSDPLSTVFFPVTSNAMMAGIVPSVTRTFSIALLLDTPAMLRIRSPCPGIRRTSIPFQSTSTRSWGSFSVRNSRHSLHAPSSLSSSETNDLRVNIGKSPSSSRVVTGRNRRIPSMLYDYSFEQEGRKRRQCLSFLSVQARFIIENFTVRTLIFVRLASLGERSASDTGLGWYDMKTLINSPLKLLWDRPLADKN